MKNALTLAYLFTTTLLFAQIEVSKESSFDIGSGYKMIELIPGALNHVFWTSHEGDIVKIVHNSTTIHVQKFDSKTLKEVKRVENTIPYYGYSDIIEFGDKCYFISQEPDRKTKETKMYAREFDLANCTLGEARTLSADPGKTKQFFISFDHSKDFIIIYYGMNHPDDADKELKKLDKKKFVVLNKDMEPVLSKEIVMPYVSGRILSELYTVNNNGNRLDILLRILDDVSKPEIVGGKGNFRFEMISLEEGSQPEINRLDEFPSDNLPYTFNMTRAINGDVILYGKYGRPNEKTKFYLTEGFYFAQLSQDYALKDIKYHQIPVNLVEEYSSEEWRREQGIEHDGKRYAFQEMEFSGFSVETDGSYTAYLQAYHVYFGDNGTKLNWFDIYSFSLANDGSVNWSMKLPVANYSVSNTGAHSSGVFYDQGANCDYFVFPDHEENLNLPSNKVPKHLNTKDGGTLVVYKVCPDGTVTKSPILDLKNAKGKVLNNLSMAGFIRYKEGEYLFEAFDKTVGAFIVKISLP